MSVIREWATFVCGASVQSLSETDRAIQRRHVADTLVAAVAGNRTTEGRALRTMVPQPSLHDAIGLQAAIIRHTEIDDIHIRSCTTPSSVTVPAALSLARAGDCEPEQVASAIWVGTELMTRLGTAIEGPKILYRGIWPTYLTAPLGAAAIASRIWRLTEEQTAHALSLALMLLSGRAGRFHGKIPGRSVILAIAVTGGLRAAAAARQGVGGDADLLDGPWLKDAHGIAAETSALTAGLSAGNVYQQLSLKPFCSAKQAISSIEAMMALLDEGIDPNAISKVRIRVPPPYSRMISTKAEAGVRSSSIVSAAFQCGLAAFRRERLYDIERSDVLNEEAARRFADKVEITADEDLLEVFPRAWPADVEIEADGKVLRKRVVEALGDPARPLDDTQLAHKAEAVLRRMDGAPPAADIVALGLAGLTDRAARRRMADTLWDACAG
jgi:2-methylcitrate dehydratase PrpD